MALFGRGLSGIRRAADALVLTTLFAGASALAMSGTAQAQNHFHGGFVRGHGGPGFYGRGYYGRGAYFPGRGWYGGWYGPRFAYWPYWPNAYAYYYPQYYYPQYVMPRAAYVMPAPPSAMAQPPRGFTVYFDFDKYNLTVDGRRVVDAAIAEAQAGGPAHIEVVGNTDLAGTNSYNYVLSQHRAETVRAYMIAHGVDPREISIRALGKTDPAVQTADGVREPRNRRVEIVITPLHRRQPPATSMAAPPPVAPVNATMAPPPPSSGPVGPPTNLVNQ